MSTTTPAPLDRIRWLPYVNSGEAAAPAGACLAITDVTIDNGQAVLQCGQFSGAGPLAFNSLQRVAAGSPGQCAQDFPALAAYDDTTLAQLWKFNAGTGFMAPPMTFAVDGKQYVAILSGLSSIALKGLNFTPETQEQRNQTMLFVFAL